MQDGLGVVGIFHVLRDTEDVAAFADVVLDVVVRALVRELGHFDSKARNTKLDVPASINTYFSEANCSSKSNRSKEGGGRSLMHGRKTAAYNCGIGVSN